MFLVKVYQRFSLISLQFFFTESTKITVICKSVCMLLIPLYQRVGTTKYVILILILDMSYTYLECKANNVDFKEEHFERD